ncbi:MAG: hypothetical protein JWN80_333, partial [Microbacteriaceae bacterium]|nr:hypothetical protein [Microbacteriaceae bacterium]
LLLTVLGELVWPSAAPAWTSSLLYVLGGLGVEEAAARQAIIRGSASGWIVPNRRGREVSWSLTPHFEQVFESGSKRVISLSDPFVDWDGSWLVLFVTVPHALRATRKRLYRDLTWAGFGNPSAGVWLSPHPERRAQVASLIDELGLADSTLSFVGKADTVGLSEREIVRQGWDLTELAARYSAVDEKFRNAEPASGDDTLFTHLRLLSAWQRFPFSDPQLPEALAPDWVGREVSSHIESLRARWTDAAHARWAQINSGSN